MAIDPQPAMTPPVFRVHPPAARPPHRVVQVDRSPHVLTLGKIAGLVALTTLGAALSVTVAVGVAFFAILNIR